MLRFSYSLLFGLLVAVSAVLLDEPKNQLLQLTTKTKPITLEDVKKDIQIKQMVQILVDCFMQDPDKKDFREAFENGLRELMEKKKFSEYTEGLLLSIHIMRNANCPRVYSLKTSTAKPTEHDQVTAAGQLDDQMLKKHWKMFKNLLL